MGALLAGYDGESSSVANMAQQTDTHKHPSVCRERLTDGSSFVYFFLWRRHLKEAEDERLREWQRVEDKDEGKECVNKGEEKREESHLNENHIQIRVKNELRKRAALRVLHNGHQS